jgi:hypothetical protein
LSVLGVLARLVLSAYSYGTDDSSAWEVFGWRVAGDELLKTYVGMRLFNHPPLMGLVAAEAFRQHQIRHIAFPICTRLWPIAGDALAVVVVALARKGARHGGLGPQWPWPPARWRS